MARKIEPSFEPSCFVLTYIGADDCVEEEAGVLDALLTILIEEDAKVAQNFMLKFLELSQSDDFIRDTSSELLVFYSRILLSIAKFCQNNRFKSLVT